MGWEYEGGVGWEYEGWGGVGIREGWGRRDGYGGV